MVEKHFFPFCPGHFVIFLDVTSNIFVTTAKPVVRDFYAINMACSLDAIALCFFERNFCVH